MKVLNPLKISPLKVSMSRILRPEPGETGFWIALGAITFSYVGFLVLLIWATTAFTDPGTLLRSLQAPEIRYAIGLTLITCTLTALLSVILAIPAGYLLARSDFPGRSFIESIIDIPIVLPPMVMGLCLLIFFQTEMGKWIEQFVTFTYTVAGVVVAQFSIAAAFAIRTMHATFQHISFRPEDVARTLGCSRLQALWLVTLPTARRGIFAAGSVAWARSLGEFGPVLVFAGATRMKTEVLPTTVWLELSVGNLDAAVAVSLFMIALAIVILVAMRSAGDLR